MDVDARMQLFDLKTKYQFQTQAGVDRYNMPLYNIQGPTANPPPNNYSGPVSYYPVYQGFMDPVYINGVQVPFNTQPNNFFNVYPNIVQYFTTVGVGDGSAGPYTLTMPIGISSTLPVNPPVPAILRGHIDINGVIAYANSLGTSSNIQDPPLITSLQISSGDNFIQSVPTTSVFPAVYFTAIGADGSNVVISDSGEFLQSNQNYGLLMQPGAAPFGNLPLPINGSNPQYATDQNTINYLSGIATNVMFPTAIPLGADINAQCYFFQVGLPRSVLFYNNVLTLRMPPSASYLVELEAYLTPAAFLNTSQSAPFAYMCEYIARGAARKILADTGDQEQFMFYEPLFREQEMLVWKRSQRQFTSTRTNTIYNQGQNMMGQAFNGFGGNMF